MINTASDSLPGLGIVVPTGGGVGGFAEGGAVYRDILASLANAAAVPVRGRGRVCVLLLSGDRYSR